MENENGGPARARAQLSNLYVPIAIVIAGGFIAGGLYMGMGKVSPTGAQPAQDVAQGDLKQMNPINKDDHIRGNPNAPVVIVEYSDFECPFCKGFHETMQRVIDEYGKDGKVAWVYRHFPLEQLHSKAHGEAVASECAAAQGGNDAFWKFTNRFYEVTPSVTSQSPTGLDQKKLPEIAKFAGLDAVGFNECLSSGRFKEKVDKQFTDGINAGVTGTPYSIIITPSGTKIPLVGAVSYATLKSTIDTLISETP